MSSLDNFSQKIAEILAELVAERGMSQNQIAASSGVSQAQISRILKQQRSVSVEDLHLIAEALGVPASTVFRRAEDAMAEKSQERVQKHSQSAKVIAFPGCFDEGPQALPEMA